MSAAIAIRARLGSITAITTLVGNRIDPEATPNEDNNTWPRITFIGEQEDRDTVYDETEGVMTVQVTVDCQALTFDGREALDLLVKDSLHHKAGTWGGIVVLGCFLQGDRKGDFIDEANRRIFYAESDYDLIFRKP